MILSPEKMGPCLLCHCVGSIQPDVRDRWSLLEALGRRHRRHQELTLLPFTLLLAQMEVTRKMGGQVALGLQQLIVAITCLTGLPMVLTSDDS